jgi:UDP-GlcNAc:undecaprenyl-phosphate GlcNAc-1-phosphate transferase
VLTFLWIAGLTNAFNLIDNMDGLCAGVVVIIGSFRCLASWQTGDPEGAVMAAIIVGGFLGFLFFNYHPAKIFMGDGGSMFGGFALATLTIAASVPRTRVFLSGLLIPALTFLYPLFDTMFVSVLRRAAGRPISVGGRDHSSHRLASLGHHESRVVWILWTLTAVGAAVGNLFYWFPLAVHVVAALTLIGVSLFGLFLATLPNYDLPSSAPIRSRGFRGLVPTLRVSMNLIVEALLAGIALLAAFLFRWENSFLDADVQQFLLSLPIVMGAQVIGSLALGTFNLGWRWIGISDGIRLAMASVVSVSVTTLLLLLFGLQDYSRDVLILYAILVFGLTIGLRLSLRVLWRILGTSITGQRVAIIGSIRDSVLLLRMLEHKEGEMIPVLIVDTDPFGSRSSVLGVPVWPFSDNACQLMKRYRVELLVMTEKNRASEEHSSFLRKCFDIGIGVSYFEYSLTPAADIKDLETSRTAI